MSTETAGSSGSSAVLRRSKVVEGNCWCSASIVELKSKTDRNPGRLFHRCEFAANMKLKDDKHLFKWVVEEDTVEVKLKRIEEEIRLMKAVVEKIDVLERTICEKIEVDIEKKVTEKLDVAMGEMKSAMRKPLVVAFVLGFVISIRLSKIVNEA